MLKILLFPVLAIIATVGCAGAGANASLTAPAAVQMAPTAMFEGSYLFRSSGMPTTAERVRREPRSQSGTIEINEALEVTYELDIREDESVSVVRWKAERPDRPSSAFTEVRLDQSAPDAPRDSGHAVVPYFDQSVGLLGQLVRYARRQAGQRVEFRVHRLIDGRTLPVTVTFSESQLAMVEVGGKTWRLALGPDDEVVAAQLTGYGVTVEPLGAQPSGLRSIWPPNGAPAGATYEVYEVRIPSEGGVTIAGTLTMPKSVRGPAPAAIMITGSGRNSRNQGSPPSMPFREIADALSSRGIAVLRVDDRGVGDSTGDAVAATTFDEARDIQAAIAFLRARPMVDPSRIALIGWSEGGLIAPMIASEDPRIAALALLSGGFAGREIAEYQVRYAVEHNPSVPPKHRERVIAQTLEGAQQHPRSAAVMSIDGQKAVRRLRMPVLLINGENDRQVPPSQALRFAMSLREAGNDDVTLALFPNLSHLLLPDPDGRVEGFPFLPSTRLPNNVVDTLVQWMVERLTPATEAPPRWR